MTVSINTSIGEFPLHEFRLRLDGREWSILHSTAVISQADEASYLEQAERRLPYGAALWPAAIALAHEIAARCAEWRDARVLELGAGTGLPGIVAATLGASVMQTDRQQVALALCRTNAERNGAARAVQREADWTQWTDETQYDCILGADILYAERLHPSLDRIFATNLAATGRILLSDPFRPAGLRLLESLDARGWRVSLSKWNVGGDDAPRPIGVYELRPPASVMRRAMAGAALVRGTRLAEFDGPHAEEQHAMRDQDRDEMSNPEHANDSASKHGHGAHGRGRGQEENVNPSVPEPEHARGSDRGGSAGWGSESSGGSVIDKRPPEE